LVIANIDGEKATETQMLKNRTIYAQQMHFATLTDNIMYPANKSPSIICYTNIYSVCLYGQLLGHINDFQMTPTKDLLTANHGK